MISYDLNISNICSVIIEKSYSNINEAIGFKPTVIINYLAYI